MDESNVYPGMTLKGNWYGEKTDFITYWYQGNDDPNKDKMPKHIADKKHWRVKPINDMRPIGGFALDYALNEGLVKMPLNPFPKGTLAYQFQEIKINFKQLGKEILKEFEKSIFAKHLNITIYILMAAIILIVCIASYFDLR